MLPHVNTAAHVAVLGLGRLGTAIAERLAETHRVRTWSRSHAGATTAARAVTGADVVLLCVYDAAACRDVIEECGSALAPGCTVVNTATVGPDEAVALAQLAAEHGAGYVHAPVVGSVPAALAGELTILTGAATDESVAEVLGRLGRRIRLAGPGDAAAAKLLANSVLGDALLSLRRSLRHADQLDLPRAAALDVLESTVLAPVVRAKRRALEQPGGRAAVGAQFTAAALRKDLALLTRATGSAAPAARDLEILMATGAVRADDDVAAVATAGLGLGADLTAALDAARLDLAAGVVMTPGVARPLVAYALGHATGDPAHFREAFLPTAHVEGHRDGSFTSWGLDEYAALFPGHPSADEAGRRRRLETVDVS